jgi:hypothetical protein
MVNYRLHEFADEDDIRLRRLDPRDFKTISGSPVNFVTAGHQGTPIGELHDLLFF